MPRLLPSALALLLCLAPRIAAAEPDLGGYLKGFAYQHLHAPGGLERAGARLQLRLSGGDARPAAWVAALDFELDSRVGAEGGGARGAGFDVYPVELYLDLVFDQLEVRLGQQYVLWGRSAFTSPVDVVTAWDYVDMASELEDRRIAPLGAKGTLWLGGDTRLEVLWLPVFTPSRLPLPPGEDGAPLPTTSLRNGEGVAGGEAGARLAGSWSAWAFDWGVSAYDGWRKRPELLPVLSEEPAGPPRLAGFTRWYPRLTLLGLDGAKALGPLVARGEAAVSWEEQLAEPAVAWTGGLDWTVTPDLTLGLEYTGRREVPEGAAEAGLRHLAGLNAQVGLGPSVTLQATALYGPVDRDFFGLGFLAWSPADALTLSAGAVLFGGPEDTPFGRQRAGSRGFFEARYAF